MDLREFRRSLAPEINNALAVILGNAQLLLLKEAVTPEGRENLRAIERSSFRIQALVQELVQGDMSRLHLPPSHDSGDSQESPADAVISQTASHSLKG